MLKPFVLGIIAASSTIGWVIAPAIAAPENNPAATPSPESQFTPKARITITSDRMNLTLINNTNALINYQVVGDTQPRSLGGFDRIALQGLRVPVTLTLDRADAGLIKATPKQSSSASDTLEVTLDATTDLNVDTTTMRIERNGSVFLY